MQFPNQVNRVIVLLLKLTGRVHPTHLSEFRINENSYSSTEFVWMSSEFYIPKV